MRLHSQTYTNTLTHFRIKVCSYSQHPGFLFGVSVWRKRRMADRARGRWRRGPPKEIYRHRESNEWDPSENSGHRHSLRVVNARAKGEKTTPVGFLSWAMTTIDDQFYLSFPFSWFFSFFWHFSPSPFLFPSLFIRASKLLVGIAFQCVNFFTPTFTSFLCPGVIYTAISTLQRLSIRNLITAGYSARIMIIIAKLSPKINGQNYIL